jgi:hypothetical protein
MDVISERMYHTAPGPISFPVVVFCVVHVRFYGVIHSRIVVHPALKAGAITH